MLSDGPGSDASAPQQTLAHWREARQWWEMEPYVEFRSYIGADGIKRTEETALPSLGEMRPTDCDARIARVSDEGAESGYIIDRSPEELRAVASTTWSMEVRAPAPMASASIDIDLWGKPRRRSSKVGEAYVPLHLFSGYAFGRSTIPVDELATTLARMGFSAGALVDPHSFIGALEFARGCRAMGIKPLIGATFELPDGGEIVLIAASKRGYATLSRLITACHLEEPRGFPIASWERLERYSQDLICLTGGSVGPLDRLLIRRDLEGALSVLEHLVRLYGRRNVFIEIERSHLPWGIVVERQLLELAEATDVTPVAGGCVTHLRREHFAAQDILTCADRLCTVDDVIGRKPWRAEGQPFVCNGPERALNAERFLRSPEEMAAHYHDRPDLLTNTLLIAARCDDEVMPGRTALPSVTDDDSHRIVEIVGREAARVYGSAYGPKHRRRLKNELRRIVRLDSSSHFLIAWDFCRWAREQGIELSGRGSVVDSAVAYVLGLSRIDAISHNLHFDRFLPADASKRPDIDIDFEARRRDDVRNYLIRKYGEEHVAAVCAIGTYGSRGIIREVGKAFAIPDETLSHLAKRLHGGITAERLESAIEARPELRDSGIPKERFMWTFRLAKRLIDLPRNVRLHSSGVVLSSAPIQEIVPVMWSAGEGEEGKGLRMIQWDKRSSKHVFDKFDILCLRGQDVLGGFQTRIRKHNAQFETATLPATDDPEVYRAMRGGELIGIPQSASPAMRQAHMRLGTKNLHEASLVQAGIRPGVGGAVKINELIARHRGKPYELEHPHLEEILGNTHGLIVFQEQVDQLLQTFCGYTSGQAEDIRDAIYIKNREGFVETVREQIISQAIARGYEPKIAEHVFGLVSQFKGYGFAQGHALAFAEVSLRSVWCQQNYPAPYFAALLDAQPAGYYGPITIANEARIRGVKMLPPDVNVSGIGFDVEDFRAEDDPQMFVPEGAIRTALKQISGISDGLRERIIYGRPYRSFFDCVTRTNPARDELERLILCGAFDSFHRNRRALLWTIPQALAHGAMLRGLTDALPLGFEDPPIAEGIEDFRPEERSVYERRILGMDVEHHLMAYERERVHAKGGLAAREASNLTPGTKAFVVGNPIRLRFPPTQSGRRVMFFDLEDETGLLNVTCFDEVYQRDGHKVICHPYVTLWGETQDRDGHLSFLVSRIHAYEPTLQKKLADPSPLPIVTADFLMT
ncbi:DNA polymerase III subunit alpha [bacterium]|nr:MAG: DNA polymerase III subunit alpha [bacterium]